MGIIGRSRRIEQFIKIIVDSSFKRAIMTALSTDNLDNIMNIVNLTPHDITVITDNNTIVYHKSGNVARVVSLSKFVKIIDTVPVIQTVFGNAIEIPDPQKDTYYIVSSVVLDNVNRNDLICPDTGPDSVVRDDNGNIIGVKRFRMS